MREHPDWIELHGSALERGQQQALRRPDLVAQVRAAVLGRLRQLDTALARPGVAGFLHAQRGFLQLQDPPGFDESRGIAQGYGLVHDDLLAYLHANIVADLESGGEVSGPTASDGCTAWAHGAGSAALVVKNRDYRGEHGVLQQVFLHRDSAWRQRTLLCVGSLGSPGAFSSGMNSDGLAVADTQIGSRDHGVGWLRYFLMTALLRACRDVAQALAFVRAVPHAGGGALVLGDRQGQVASVELGCHTPSQVTQSLQWVAQTNHCTDSALALDVRLPVGDPTDCTFARLEQVRAALSLAAGRLDLAQARRLMSSHRECGGICRHAHGETSRTLSCVVYDTRDTSLHMSHGNPCNAPWKRYCLAPAGDTGRPAP
jgi:hypothetical protein